MAERAERGRRDNAADGRGQTSTSPRAAQDDGREALLRELQEINERLVVASVRQQELAEQAQKQAAQWNALLNSLNEGVIVVDARAQVVMINPTGRFLLRLSPTEEARPVSEWTGTTFYRLDGSLLPPEEQPIGRALRGETFTDDEIILSRPKARRLRVTFNGSAITDDEGRVDLAICVFRDVSDLRELERAREEYVALISHDLRGPLTSVIGRADLLYHTMVRRGRGLEQDHKNIAAIRKSARQMNAMIQDLVDTARLESGKFTLRSEPTDLAGLVRDIVEGSLSPEDQRRTRIEIKDGLPIVLADSDRVQRVVSNLLSNALKYSPAECQVDLRVTTRESEVIVSVADRGIGIAPTDVANLFEKYYRSPQSRATEGLGLGLYIARLIVEASGGRIWAESELGKGSTFSFGLPRP